MEEQRTNIVKPGPNDVLSGRGNFVNHHSGNEQFRKLVKHHKEAYVACPKAQKAIYSKIIYDEIRSMNPPGRFLKQDSSTKLWNDIGEKKALDKIRQALREGAPELLKELEKTEGGTSAVPQTANAALQQQATRSSAGNNDYVAPLNQFGQGGTVDGQRQQNLRDSLLSIGSFSLGSLGQNNMAAGGAGIPGQVQVNAVGAPNPNQMQNLQPGNNQMAQNIAHLQLLQSLQQQQGGMNPAQMNMNLMNNNMQLQQALHLAAQQGTLSNDQIISLMAINANMNNNSNFGNAFQQAQLTQQFLMNQMAMANMNNSASTLVTGNISNELQQTVAGNQALEDHTVKQQPAAAEDTVTPLNQGSSNLNPSLTRGLKNNFLQRAANKGTEQGTELKSSLMSIDSLMLDDIDNKVEIGNMNVFEGADSKMSGGETGEKSNSKGSPHDMSEVSELDMSVASDQKKTAVL